MAELFPLRNRIKHYDWGSPNDIPRLLGCTADGTPCAELWMGTHAGAPSMVRLPEGEVGLGEFLCRSPQSYPYGELPFLFKLLAAEKPLSIQAHPNSEQARAGFERENQAGLARDAPDRNYRDANHKPEIVCALTPFTGMCGFREPAEIRQLLADFLEPPSLPAAPDLIRSAFAPLLQVLAAPDSISLVLRTFWEGLFNLSPPVRSALTDYILNQEWELMRRFAALYPGDPAVIAPLYLNIFTLEPGQAVFLRAGVLHAYIHGFAVELMAGSDNVLRGGLTPKHIDVPELLRILDFSPFKPQIITPEPGFSCFTYPTPCKEFSLTVMRGSGTAAVLPAGLVSKSPVICIVTEGEAVFPDQNMILKQGESAFIPPAGSDTSPVTVRGHYTLYAAAVPNENPG